MTDIALPTPVLAYQGLHARGPFRVAGFKARFTAETRAEIPKLWDRLVPRLPLPGQTSFATYGLGLCVRGELEEASFDYMAGAEIPPDAPVPDTMAAEEVPGQTYAVFRQTLELAPLHPQMRAATEEIWGRRLKADGLEPSGGPDFEFYPDDFNPTQAGAVVEYWIPVKA